MNEHTPALIPAAGEDSPDTIMRGSKMRIYPKERQAKTMDLWRNRCRQLWNLLLALEQAAYSGENVKTQLGWRSIWAKVIEDDATESERVYRDGKRRKDGVWLKEPGEGREDERGALVEKRKKLKPNSREYKELTARLKLIAPAPKATDADMLAKIRRQRTGAVDVHPETGEVTPAQPRLFVWEQELQKIMARLKQVPRTRWIDDLPSHAAQTVVKDLIKALQAMLRERKKRIAGTGGRDTGFPKFKINRYAAGSVYFANTQLQFEAAEDGGTRVKLPNGVGWMRCRMPAAIADAYLYGTAKLMGGRIWRQGEDWYLSCQFEVPKPAPLPLTDQVAAIKLAASIPVTVHALGRDGRWRTREYEMPPIDKDLLAAHKAAGRGQSRVLVARDRRVKKLKRSPYATRRETARVHARQEDAVKLFACPHCEQTFACARSRYHHAKARHKGQPLLAELKPGTDYRANARMSAKIDRPPRIPLSPAFYAHAAKLAELEARDANVRDAWLHELTTRFVRENRVIAVQRMEVARMMKKPEPPEDKEDQVKPEWQGKRRSLKAARVLMRRSMPARFQMTLAYKATDLRGADAYEEIPPQHITAGACSGCGVLHPEWKEARRRGKTIMRCQEPLADGKTCNTVLHYTRNSARVMARDLQQRLEARAERKG